MLEYNIIDLTSAGIYSFCKRPNLRRRDSLTLYHYNGHCMVVVVNIFFNFYPMIGVFYDIVEFFLKFSAYMLH